MALDADLIAILYKLVESLSLATFLSIIEPVRLSV